MTNINAKKRLTQVIIAFVIICMAVTGSAFLLKDGIKNASAAERSQDINSQDGWNNFVGSLGNGDVGNIRLTGNITVSSKLRAIPAGATVNLNMNGRNITWDVEQRSRIFADSYTSGTYADGTYWGMITNNGTLNVTGTGTVRNKKIGYYEEYKELDNCPQRVATFVNNGTMTLGSGITVEAYLTNYNARNVSGVAWNNKSFNDTFLYCCGVYNTGTLTSSSNINSGSMVAAPGAHNHASYIYSISYGIYSQSGTVTTRGGNIYCESNSGNHRSSNDCSEGGHHVAISVGVFSNAASILGKTSIETYSRTWMSYDDNDTWKTGLDLEYSAGVLYTSTNYPLIGAGVSIESRFHQCADKETVVIPGASDPNSMRYSDLHVGDNPNNYARRAYTVVGVAANNNTIGTHTSEKAYNADGGFFGSNTYYGSDNDVERKFGYTNAKYLAEDPYYDGNRSNSYLVDCANSYRRESGPKTGETPVARIVNGVPSAGDQGQLFNNLTAPSAGGSQYVIIYRYYNNNTSPENLASVSYKYNSAMQSSAAYVNVNGSRAYNGIIPGGQTLAYGGGGASRNQYYYSFSGFTFERLATTTYVARSIDNKDQWKTQGTNLLNTTTVTPSANNTIVIYANYVLRQPTSVRVAAANKGVEINQYTTTTDFTVNYTGNPLVPGTDFNIGIIDMGAQTELALNDCEDDTVVTNVYNIRGNGSGSGNNATAVTYRYTTDAAPSASSVWSSGLPKDAGKYTIEVTVNADTTFASTGTYNRNGTKQYITCTINKANVTVSGATARTKTYGDNLATFVPFNEYTVRGANNESVSGTWSFDEGMKPEDFLDAGTYNLNLVWTPTPGSASEKNYNSTTYSVTLVVNKRAVTVNVGNSKVGYGDETVKYTLKFTNLAACDNDKIDGWEKATTGKIYFNEAWQAYTAGVPMGTYPAQIDVFGGASDKNNTFTYNTEYGSLEVGKRILYYTATATDRFYIPGNSNVDVKLTYKDGVVEGDTVPQEITNVIGVMSNPNAGEGKNVTIDVSKIDSPIGNNYQIVVDNATSLTVNIAKAIPAGVACVANPDTRVYDSTKTLADVALRVTSSNVAGRWQWKDASIVPTCDVKAYTAVFTPTDTQNYESIEQSVSLNVEQKEVLITVPEQTLTYGDSQPALAGLVTYSGFTGDDSRENVLTTGEVTATTSYSRGADAGEYAIEVKSTLASTNYKFTVQNSKITVNKKDLVVKALDKALTYGDNKPEFSDADVTVTGFYNRDSLTSGAVDGTLVINTPYVRGNGIGTYPINVSGITAKNYNIEFRSGTLTVGKAELTVKPVEKTIEYGVAVPNYFADNAYTVTGFVGDDTAASVAISGAPAFTTLYTQGSNVGTYTVTLDVSQMSSANYNFKAEDGNLIVVKATPSISTVPNATIVNGQKYSEAVFSGTGNVINPNNGEKVAGTFSFANPDTVADFKATGGLIQVDFIFTPADDVNYNTAVKGPNAIIISEKEISGKPIVMGSVMEGQTLKADVSAMDPADSTVYTYQWYKDGNVIGGATSQTYTIGNADLGSQIYVVVTAVSDSGYKGSAQSDPTSKVIKQLTPAGTAQLDITIPATSVYDGTARVATAAVKSGFENRVGKVTVKYNGSATAPTAAGSYIVTVDIEAPVLASGDYDSSYHFGPVSGLEVGRFTIDKAPLAVSVEAENKVYNGSTAANATLTIGGIIGDDDVALTDGYTFAFDRATVGERNVIVSGLALKGADAANYKIELQNATASITPATLRARVSGVTKVYDGSAVVDVRFTNVEGYVGGDSSATVYITDGKAYAERADVGTGINLSNVTYTLKGASSGNYVLEFVNQGTVDITQAEPEVTVPAISGLVYDSARTLANVDLSAYTTVNGSWRFDDTTIVPTVTTKKYAATFYPASNNYKTYSTEITLDVLPKQVVIKAEDKIVKYGQNAPSFTYTADGLTGTDRLEDIGGAGVSATTVYYAGQPVGTYAIKLDAHFDSDNYAFTTQDGNLAVTPATLVVDAKAVDKVYDGSTEVTVNFNVVSGKFGNDNVSLTYNSIIGYAATANAGVTSVSYVAPELTGSAASNYELYITPATNVLTVNIAKANVTGVVFPTEGEVQFGYDLTRVKFATEGVGAGTFEYENAKGTIPEKIGVYNTYKVIFTPDDSRNYNTQEQIVTLTVVKCRLDYVVGIAGTAQEGQKLSVAITGMPSLANNYILYQWYKVDSNGAYKIEGATESTYTATKADIGYTLLVVTYFPSDAPYIFSDAANVVPVEEGVEGLIGQTATAVQAVKLSFWQRLLNWIYRLIAAISGIRISAK